MTVITPAGATIPGVTHHLADVDGTRLHYVSAGTSGSPVLLAHGWPESWWAFRKLIPLLAQTHRVFAVDLRGFGDSGTADGRYECGGKGVQVGVHGGLQGLAFGLQRRSWASFTDIRKQGLAVTAGPWQPGSGSGAGVSSVIGRSPAGRR